MQQLSDEDTKVRSLSGVRERELPTEVSEFYASVRHHLLYTCVKDARDATAFDLYRAMAYSVRDRLVQRWIATQRTYAEKDAKCVYYLSSEFLTGRSLGLCLLNLGLYGAAEGMAKQFNMDFGDVIDSEGDPGLGNGGLGRLAACFMDALATLELPAVGYGIRYDYGIFEQRIERGQQVEHRDNWLQLGNPWELPRHEHTQRVRLYGRVEVQKDMFGRSHVEWVDTRTVVGLPFDSFIVGHETHTVNTLRLWAARASHDFDLKLFNEGDYRRAVEEKVDVENISKVLYPPDHTEEGKELRLKQQYFFVACSLADIVRSFKERHSDFARFPEKAAIQLNDTHPSIAVAELMRILVDEEHLDFDAAFDITERTFGYTNHTLLPEALEKWSVSLLGRVLPRHLSIIYEINHRFMRKVQTRWPGDLDRMSRMSIIEEHPVKQVRMAHLATVGSHSVNGVAALHSELVKNSLLSDFYELFPERFNNKTNGITPRRWLLYANPRLSELICELLGPRAAAHDLENLVGLRKYADDAAVLSRFAAIKYENKLDLGRVIEQRTGVIVDPASMFVVQVKRIHEYKRQLLACLGIVARYLQLKDQPNLDATPRTYVFAGKAAAGYATAKQHTRDKLKVVFVPNYGVTLAQTIIPAANLSLQISQAGKEASGTSNMKFALNGAPTLGTLDGANVEIRDAVGHPDFFLFGLTVDGVRGLYERGYRPEEFIAKSPYLGRVIALLRSGFFSLGDVGRYASVAEYLEKYDPYMICADFDAYLAEEERAAQLYRDPQAFARCSLLNTAGGGAFSSDATISAYAREIWDIAPVSADMSLVSPIAP